MGQINKEGPGGGKGRTMAGRRPEMKVARLAARQVASPLPCQHFLMSPWLGCVGGGAEKLGLTFPRPQEVRFGVWVR